MHEGELILYNTGDFVDDYAVDGRLRNDLSALFLVEVAPPDIKGLDLMPVQIMDMRVNLAKGVEREWIVRRLTDLSEELGTRVGTAPDGLLVSITLR